MSLVVFALLWLAVLGLIAVAPEAAGQTFLAAAWLIMAGYVVAAAIGAIT
jgi:hypothetical protein